VLMKDGNEIEISGSGASTNALGASINLMFKQPVNTADIDKIIIWDLEIEY